MHTSFTYGIADVVEGRPYQADPVVTGHNLQPTAMPLMWRAAPPDIMAVGSFTCRPNRQTLQLELIINKKRKPSGTAAG